MEDKEIIERYEVVYKYCETLNTKLINAISQIEIIKAELKEVKDKVWQK